MKIIIFAVFAFFCLQFNHAFGTSGMLSRRQFAVDQCPGKKNALQGRRRLPPLRDVGATLSVDKDIVAEKPKKTAAATFANFLGYAIGIGSLSLYSPIIYTILSRKSAEGFAVQTWVFNLIGLSFAAAYPYQKGYTFSTYAELLILSIQSVGILGLVCYFKGLMTQYLIGMSIYAVAAFYAIFRKVPTTLMNGLQGASTLSSNYANIPQIVLSATTKSCSWSPFTAGCGMLGNLIRIFTTMNLAGGDKLIIAGYILGATTNGMLFALGLMYPPMKVV